jgi:hypothetical protein
MWKIGPKINIYTKTSMIMYKLYGTQGKRKGKEKIEHQ